jgi:hypothetical protein
MKEIPSHTLPSFTGYLHKVFGFRAAAARLRDARQNPEFSPQSVFLAVFHAFVFRLPSFQQLEAELAQPALRRWLGLERGFGDDVLRYSLCGFELDGLEQMLVDVNRRLKRNKAFDAGRVRGRIVAALDGIEVLSSYSRCCEACLSRRVTLQDERGQPVERTQYYHRAVGCQIVSAPVKSFLALEWLQPGEGEDTAARRLLARLPELYGSPFFDILLLDSLYAQAPVLKLAREIGWDLVITLRQENREVYQNAAGLFGSRAPDRNWEDQQEGRTRHVRVWDTEGLPFSADYPQPVRVLRAEEQLTAAHYRDGQRREETTTHHWVWITTLDGSTFPTEEVWQLGHLRWKNENNGWNDLTQHWALKHGFLHACKHRPTRLSPSGQRQPVPNRGLAAVALIRCLAFTLSSAFTLLHSKIVRRYRTPLIEVARQLYRSLWQLCPPARAPTPPAQAP